MEGAQLATLRPAVARAQSQSKKSAPKKKATQRGGSAVAADDEDWNMQHTNAAIAALNRARDLLRSKRPAPAQNVKPMPPRPALSPLPAPAPAAPQQRLPPIVGRPRPLPPSRQEQAGMYMDEFGMTKDPSSRFMTGNDWHRYLQLASITKQLEYPLATDDTKKRLVARFNMLKHDLPKDPSSPYMTEEDWKRFDAMETVLYYGVRKDPSSPYLTNTDRNAVSNSRRKMLV
jgi:hypothetical protein